MLFRSVLECIVVLNKSDLPKRAQLLGKLGGIPAVRVSCISGFGLDELRTMIGETALKAIPTEHQSVVVNERQKVLFQHAVKSLTGSIQLIDNQHWNDTIAQEIRNALHSVDEVVGKSFGEDVLDRIFSRFCIGK